MLKKLTVEEKIKLLVAGELFATNSINGKLPKIVMSDGPNGVRWGVVEDGKKYPSICYPSAQTIANSWDKDVAKNVGISLASDCIDNNIDIILGPGINIKRTPLCGRNFEYYSEDPYLTSELSSEYVLGVQNQGVLACLKHFCANNREYDRNFQTSEVDMRTLREIYTKAFEDVIKKTNVRTIMSSYNPVNGVNMSENKGALKGLLREKLGFDGVIISDWCAVHNRTDALKASLDIMFPFEQRGIDDLMVAYQNNQITEAEIDESVGRILNLCQIVQENRKKCTPIPIEKRKENAVDGARKGIVLLKNDNDILPLKNVDKIAVLGPTPTYCGGGSSEVYLSKPLVGIEEELKTLLPNVEINYHQTFSHASCILSPANVMTVNVKKAYELAYDNDVTILQVGTSQITECESYDRDTIKLSPVLEDLIIKISQKTKNLIVLLSAGSAVDVSGWIDNVKALVYTGFAGEGVNKATAEILVGKTCPSGRLSETFPIRLEDTPTGSYRGDGYVDRYSEGVLIGYRHYTTKNVDVMYPFGYGLTYANFVYSDFNVTKLGEYDFKVRFKVKNASTTRGGDVPQLYIKNVDKCVERPIKELRRFEKVYLDANEEKEITFLVDKQCFEYFDVWQDCFEVLSGRYEIAVCKDANTDVFVKKIKI